MWRVFSTVDDDNIHFPLFFLEPMIQVGRITVQVVVRLNCQVPNIKSPTYNHLASHAIPWGWKTIRGCKVFPEMK